MEPLPALQRVEIRDPDAEKTVGVDQLQHMHLLSFLRRHRIAGRRRREQRGGLLGPQLECLDDRRMGNVTRRARQLLQAIEIGAPFLVNRGRIVEIGFVQLLDERGIRSGQVRTFQHVLHRAHCDLLMG